MNDSFIECVNNILNNYFTMFLQIITSFGTFVALIALAYQMYRDRETDSKEQASKVCCWLERNSNYFARDIGDVYSEIIIVSNESNQPIYDVRVSIQMVTDNQVDDSHDYEYEYVQCLAPGTYRIAKSNEYKGMNKIFNAAMSFRDANGYCWNRNGAGILTKCKKEKYRIIKPEVPARIEKIR